MIIVTTFYSDPHSGRRSEFHHCIRRNCANPMVRELYVFIEDTSDPSELSVMVGSPSNIHLVRTGRRMTYRELFNYANKNFAGHNVIIANGDIFFDQSLQRLRGQDLFGRLLCLSRWDVEVDGSARLFDHAASQDAWIFRAPIPELTCDFPMGMLGCDNRLAWEAEQAGLRVSNPARSIRAYHLHLSGVRRYRDRDRLLGPVASVPPGYLGSPWLWFVARGASDPNRARPVTEALAAQAGASTLVVIGSAVSTSGVSAEETHPNITLFTVPHAAFANGVTARTEAISIADPDGALCFVDDELLPAAGFSDFILSRIDEMSAFVPPENVRGFNSTLLVCSKAAFDRVGGFDRSFRGWGEEVADLRNALSRQGLMAHVIPDNLLSPSAVSDGRASPDYRGPDARHGIHSAYRRAKSAILDETGGAAVAPVALIEIYSAIKRHKLLQVAARPETPLAAIALHENMGYSLGCLELGHSSHNNEWRPFRAIPAPLLGLPFTQVVAYSVSPIKVEFLRPGKLYVLVGTDWDGHSIASAWLEEAGCREPLPSLETERGTSFEVWSLIGDAGEVIVIPTQVMLVAAELVQRGALHERNSSWARPFSL